MERNSYLMWKIWTTRIQKFKIGGAKDEIMRLYIPKKSPKKLSTYYYIISSANIVNGIRPVFNIKWGGSAF